MASFTTDFDDRVGITMHRIPLEELERFIPIGTVGYLTDYPKRGQRLRYVELRVGSILITMFADMDSWEEMPDES